MMIRAQTPTDLMKLDSAIEINHLENPYLYINLQKFGIKSNFCKVWFSETNGVIKQILLNYFNTVQVISNDCLEHIQDMAELILSIEPKMISGTKYFINELHKLLKFNYSKSFGYLLNQKNYSNSKPYILPRRAMLHDIASIVKLICSDPLIGAHYSEEELKEQMVSRIKEKFGRNYVIEVDNEIIAHYATYAEIDTMAILGGLIVHPRYRGLGYAKALHSTLSNELLNENKQVIFFCAEKNLIDMYKKFGAVVIGNYGKLTIR